MLVNSNVFQVFYQKLKNQFIERELDGKPDNKRDSPTIWDDEGKSGTKKSSSTGLAEIPAATVLFSGSRTNDPRYFYRKHIELSPKLKDNGKIDDLAFFKALEFIGITPSKEIPNWDKLPLQQKLKTLFEEFVTVYRIEIEAEEKINKEENIAPQKFISHFNASEPEDLSSNITAVKYTVQRFYENIATSNLEDAWNLMSPEIQNRRPWKGVFEKFRDGYTNTNNIRNIVVFNVSQNVPNVIDCRVFYEDEISCHTTKELSSLDSLTVGDLATFVDNIKKMKKNFEAKGLKNFDQIELSKLFEPAASEYIWYKCSYDPSNLHELFSSQKAIIVKRVYDCSCRYYTGTWLINNINAMRSYSAR